MFLWNISIRFCVLSLLRNGLGVFLDVLFFVHFNCLAHNEMAQENTMSACKIRVLTT